MRETIIHAIKAKKSDETIIGVINKNLNTINTISKKDGKLPITVAAETGSFEVVKHLLELGCGTHAEKVGQFPLYYAISRPDIVKLMLRHGATLPQTDGGIIPIGSLEMSLDEDFDPENYFDIFAPECETKEQRKEYEKAWQNIAKSLDIMLFFGVTRSEPCALVARINDDKFDSSTRGLYKSIAKNAPTWDRNIAPMTKMTWYDNYLDMAKDRPLIAVSVLTTLMRLNPDVISALIGFNFHAIQKDHGLPVEMYQDIIGHLKPENPPFSEIVPEIISVLSIVPALRLFEKSQEEEITAEQWLESPLLVKGLCHYYTRQSCVEILDKLVESGLKSLHCKNQENVNNPQLVCTFFELNNEQQKTISDVIRESFPHCRIEAKTNYGLTKLVIDNPYLIQHARTYLEANPDLSKRSHQDLMNGHKNHVNGVEKSRKSEALAGRSSCAG
ncbi:MAG: ankyrin repeat domain-containing protein [Alphaproteobacteria bacterium]|nr:ankyrin repeat domain-containing protein [Alphaproteobacteria bacterium]